MPKNVFSVSIYEFRLQLFRESLEASIIVAVLLSLVEQIVLNASLGHPSLSSQAHREGSDPSLGRSRTRESKAEGPDESGTDTPPQDHAEGAQPLPHDKRRLIRKMRLQVLTGAAAGLVIALAMYVLRFNQYNCSCSVNSGAAFIAVWFTKVVDLFSSAEELWEGIFSLIASRKVEGKAFGRIRSESVFLQYHTRAQTMIKGKMGNASGKNGKWILFILPFITVLREGLEAVVFVGGVSLGQSATSIPLAAIIGLICGLLVGYLIYATSSRTSAGLFSKSVGAFERYKFNTKVGGDVAEAGNGPGSYDVVGNIWHLNCCNPESKTDALGWSIFSAIFGWSNNGSRKRPSLPNVLCSLLIGVLI
ncbi:putative iron permease FTR1 [Rhizoctonia solani AG-1 IA]|uniref:Putative iron permease FTR1 n=1 Tax=Thanatephorus cucumeris (strain AG1-IA) TaxID=983506 RepID=L8WWZ1_THACA|nr:putative iron permease FTR1 [Rhizoctonia solani AG-1 IA]